MNTYVAIMAGGIGSRFWPASRTARPKQFLDILNMGKSLIQLTYERFLKLVPKENILIVTNGQYKALVKEHLPELTDNQILCEPSRNNTAPCIAYTAFKLQQANPKAKLVVAPSDHIIIHEENFIDTVKAGLEFTDQMEALLTLGIQPNRPDTGYGYIQFEKQAAAGRVHKVVRFTEKPPREQAEAYLKSGDYLWNAGIFIWKVEHVLNAFQKYAPDIHRILGGGGDQYNSPLEQAFIDRAYPTTPSISVDYALMEKADNIYTIPSDFGWSDLGTWASLHVESPKDEAANAVSGQRIILHETQNTLVRAPENKLVLIKGLEDFIVVDEEDVLLIYPKSQEQEIKQAVKQLGEQFGDTYL